MYSLQQLEKILHLWGLKIKALHPDIFINGSPERALYRTIVEDQGGRFYILEQIPSFNLKQKLTITKTLRYLWKQGFSTIEPYLPDLQGNDIVEYDNQFWQLLPYIQGVPLSRPEYVFEEWRGFALAHFLIDLKEKSTGLQTVNSTDVFSIKNYIFDFMIQLKKNNPKLLPEVSEVFLYLKKEFFKVHDKLPIAFCHGDYHPLNVIWGEKSIRKVIDWEFMGYKPEIYDVANMIGCLGMEEPKSLISGIVGSFVRELRKKDFMQLWSWRYLHEFIIALRFAWLAEWLRKDDKEMIELELVYMFLLIDNRGNIERVWHK